MRSVVSFMKKEAVEHIRNGKLTVIGLLFILIGIMNPAFAKLTPWMLETMSSSLQSSGIVVGEVTVSAYDSWMQFFKNIPMALIAFVIFEGGILTKEYDSTALVLTLTRGLERYKVVLSKALIMILLWTGAYFACFFVTYGYTVYFWDDLVGSHLGFAILGWWALGLFSIMLILLFSAILRTASSVLLSVLSVFGLTYFLGMFSKIAKFSPAYLMKTTPLLYGTDGADSYFISLSVTLVLSFVCFALSIVIFNKKQI